MTAAPELTASPSIAYLNMNGTLTLANFDATRSDSAATAGPGRARTRITSTLTSSRYQAGMTAGGFRDTTTATTAVTAGS